LSKNTTLRTMAIPDQLWDEFEQAIRGKYATVSEAVRDLMRRFIEEHQKKQEA